MNLKQAKTNLLFLTGKSHNLFTCLYVIKNMKEYFIEETSSKIFLKKVSEEKIDHYIAENEVTTLSCVGSYKIEDNNKYKFLEIVKGDEESIVGFPIKKFIKKIRKVKIVKLFVIGKPLEHSMSPIIQNYWLKKYSKPYSYSKKGSK